MANEGYRSGELSKTQQTGVIRLVYKKGDREDSTNWRPITLLDTDSTIIAKILANLLTD